MPAWQEIPVREPPNDSNNRCGSRFSANSAASPVSTRQWPAKLYNCRKFRRKNSFGTQHGTTYNIAMKTIQITMDEELLARLDKSEEVQQIGRSAVLRRAAAEYLARQSRREIARQYQEAYGAGCRPGE